MSDEMVDGEDDGGEEPPDITAHPNWPLISECSRRRRDPNRQSLKQLVRDNPKLLHISLVGAPLLNEMAKENDVDMLEFLLNEGALLNLPEHKQGYPSALMDALVYDARDAVSYLIDRGADTNAGRVLIQAINSKRHSLEFVKLLVEHGANINERFDFGRAVVTPLSWAIATGKTDVADYLRSLGAELPVQDSIAASEEPGSEAIAYFEEHVGNVSPLTLTEIIPSGTPVTVHVIPPSDEREYVTFFTTGLSENSMTVLAEASAEDYRFAELYIQLPGDWPITGSIENPKYAWPLRWLRYLGAYPSMENSWFGGAVAVVTVGELPSALIRTTGSIPCCWQRIGAFQGRTARSFNCIVCSHFIPRSGRWSSATESPVSCKHWTGIKSRSLAT